MRALGASLTGYPRPREGGALVARGPYRVVRHPMYAGGLLVLAGISLATSPLALVPTVLLGVVWALKSVVEEGFLKEEYSGYEGYCEATRYRLVPFVY